MRLLFFWFLVVSVTTSIAQSDGDYRTDQTGNWSSATTWEVFVSGAFQDLETPAAGAFQNVIPSDLSGAVNIQNNITITASVTADQLTLTSGTLTISAGQVLSILDGVDNDFVNLGGIVTTTGTLSIAASAVYEHARNGGTIPLATWGPNSTCLVTGIAATNPTLIAANAYENFTWDCVQTGTRNLGGNLRTVNGDLLILNTNNQALQFSTGIAYTLDVAGDFTVSDNSRIQFCTTASPVVVNLEGNFDFSSTAITASTLKTSGSYTFNVAGDFSQNSGTLNISGGGNIGTINVEGNFVQSGGTLSETGAGSGLLAFVGTGGVQSIVQSGTISNTINLSVSNPDGVVLNSNVTLPGGLSQLLGAGDVDLNGFILTINGSLSQASGSIATNSTSELILQGSGTLPGAGFPISFAGSDMGRLRLNKTGTLETASAISIENLDLYNGSFDSNTISIAPGGTIERRLGTITNPPAGSSYNLVYTITVATNTGPEMPASATVLNDLTKQGTAALSLNQALATVNGDLTLTAGTFSLGTNSVTLAGNFTSNSALTSASGSVFTISGTCSLSGAIAPTFDELVVSGTLTPAVGYRVNGNFTVANGATVNSGTGIVTFGGTTVITNDGTMNLNAVTIGGGFTMTAPITTMGIAGNFTSTGTFADGGGTILFNGTTNLTGVEVYNNITVTGTVTSTGNSSQTVAGNLINNGSFSLGTGNLTWSGNGTLSGNGNTTVGDLNITGTSCTYTASGTLTLNDDLLGVGSFDSSDSGAGAVIFAGAGSAIGGAGAKTLRNISVTGTLTPATTYTLVGVGGLDVSGILASGGTIIFGGTTQTISGTGTIAFNVFTTNVGSVLTITPDITINGNLTGDGNIIASGTITFVGLTMSGAGLKSFNNVTVSTGTFTPNSDYSITGNLVINGTLAAGNSTTTFSGTTAISGVGATTFNFLVISGTLTSSSGTVSIVRDFTNNGTFNHNNGTISFSTTGTTLQNIAGSQSILFNNLVINNSGGATDVTNNITSPATVSLLGTLSFGENNSVFDADGSGALDFVLLSTNDDPTADARIAAITTTGSNISGNFTVQRFVSNEASGRFYRYISSPLVGATVANLKSAIPVTGTFTDPSDGSSSPPCTGCITTSPSLFSYNETTNAYVAFPASGLASANAFTNGRGYSAFFRHTGSGGVGDATINFRGTNPSTGTIALPVSPNASGFSLVGNPYPSAIVWDNNAGWAKTNIADGIVVRDNSTGVHQSYSAASGTGVIAAGQAFWVQSSLAGASLSINQNAKTATSTSFYRLDQPIADQLEVQLVKGSTGTMDVTRIEIRNNSVSGLDSYDVFKFNNNLDNGTAVTEVHDVAVLSGSSMLLVSSVPTISCSEIVNLRINDILNNGETTASYTLDINLGGSFASMNWVLQDQKTGLEHNLSTGPYQFTVTSSDIGQTILPFASGTRYFTNRFSLRANQISINTSLQVTAQNILCNGSEAVVRVANSQQGMTYGLEINGQLYPSVKQGNGGDLNIFIPSENLIGGANQIRVHANGGCDSQFLANVSTINKEEVFTITETTGASLCRPGAAILNALASSEAASYRWYENETSTQILGTSAQWETPELNNSTVYYVSAVNASGCESQRVAAQVDITDVTTSIEIESSGLVCSGESITLTADAATSNVTFKWYESMTSETPLKEGSSFATPALPKSTKYYVSLTSPSGCEGERVEVFANVASYDPELSSLTETQEICVGGSYNFTAQGAPAGSTYRWFDSMEDTVPIYEGLNLVTPQLTESRLYFIESRSEFGCSSRRFAVQANVTTSLATLVSMTPIEVCPGTEPLLNLVPGHVSNVNYRWYESAESGAISIHEGLQWTIPPVESTTSYYVSALNSSGCESSERKKITINVVSIQEPIIDSPGSGLLRAVVSVGDLQWYFNDQEILGETGKELIIGDAVGAYSLTVTHNGCQTTSSRYADQNIVTSVNDLPSTFYVYPNPADERIFIEVIESNPVKAQLIDIKGATIESINLYQTNDRWKGEIDVSGASAGNYFIRLTSGKKSITHQVIIRK